jgi:arsenate reductase (glutaredoxin)
MTVTLYGIPNCSAVKKARAWLDANAVEHVFHDFKKSGIEPGLIAGWLKHIEWDALVNRKGTTWRGLPDARKAAVTDAASAAELMLESPSVIKRPVLCAGSAAYCGFSDGLYQQIFKK